LSDASTARPSRAAKPQLYREPGTQVGTRVPNKLSEEGTKNKKNTGFKIWTKPRALWWGHPATEKERKPGPGPNAL